MKNKETILNSHESLCLYFKSPNCGVCEVVLPKVQKLFEKRFKKVNFQVIDIANEPNLATEFMVFTAPTILIFFDKKEYIKKSRTIFLDELEKEISRVYDLYYG